MKFEYTGRHIEVTPAMKTHVEEHFDRIDHLFKGKPAHAHVIIEVERGRHMAEVVVTWWNETMTATATNSDMYISLSQAVSKIEKQASKLKNKIIDKSHKAKKVSKMPNTATVDVGDGLGKRIVKTRRYAIKPMTADEAAIDLDSRENAFLVFRNAENDRVSVIYQRKDGNYGLIEP